MWSFALRRHPTAHMSRYLGFCWAFLLSLTDGNWLKLIVNVHRPIRLDWTRSSSRVASAIRSGRHKLLLLQRSRDVLVCVLITACCDLVCRRVGGGRPQSAWYTVMGVISLRFANAIHSHNYGTYTEEDNEKTTCNQHLNIIGCSTIEKEKQNKYLQWSESSSKHQIVTTQYIKGIGTKGIFDLGIRIRIPSRDAPIA